MTWWRGIWETLIGFRDLLLQPPKEEIHSMILSNYHYDHDSPTVSSPEQLRLTLHLSSTQITDVLSTYLLLPLTSTS